MQTPSAYLNFAASQETPQMYGSTSYPNAEIRKLGLTYPLNSNNNNGENARRFSFNSYHYPEASLIQLATSTVATTTPILTSAASNEASVRLSNLKSFDLLKRKKPSQHVLAALRQTKIEEESDLLNEASRLNRRTKKFKFQFQKSKGSDKLEIEGNAEAKLVDSHKDNQEDEHKEDEQNGANLMLVQEENAPAVVLIKKVVRGSTTKSTSTSTTTTTTTTASTTSVTPSTPSVEVDTVEEIHADSSNYEDSELRLLFSLRNHFN